MKNRFNNILFLLLISLTWLLIGWVLHSVYSQITATPALSPQTTLIESARNIILNRQRLTTTVTTEQLTYAAIRGMIAQTADPKAVLFTPPISQYYAEDLAGATGVSGVVFDVIDHKIVIMRSNLMKTQPAMKSVCSFGGPSAPQQLSWCSVATTA